MGRKTVFSPACWIRVHGGSGIELGLSRDRVCSLGWNRIKGFIPPEARKEAFRPYGRIPLTGGYKSTLYVVVILTWTPLQGVYVSSQTLVLGFTCIVLVWQQTLNLLEKTNVELQSRSQ